MMAAIKSVTSNQFFVLFLATGLGLLLGKVKVKKISLSTSGALFIGLAFGALGYESDKLLFSFSLIIFISAVGLLAAKDIGRVIRLYGIKFMILGVVITFLGAFTTYVMTVLIHNYLDPSIDPNLIAGSFTGALTSSPGLAAALEATCNNSMVTAGHVLAYPFGVLTVISFIHLAPVVFKIDVIKELEDYREQMRHEKVSYDNNIREHFDVLSFVVVLIVGILIGNIPIKVPFINLSVKLEMTGGVLISALVLGHRGKIGSLNMNISKEVLAAFRELGIALFLAIVGIQGGAGFVKVIGENGLILAVISTVASSVSVFIGFLIGRYILRLNWILLLGALCGGMTSTPGLGVAIDATGTDEVAIGYGATYPIALLFMIVWTILLHMLV